MERISDIKQAEGKVLSDIREFILTVRNLSGDVNTIGEGIGRLRRIRGAVYENMNQIQHEYLILQGIKWLSTNGYDIDKLELYWNPRQTGDSNEPDLVIKHGSQIVACAEVTTSENPVGTIDTRMRETLNKLNIMDGDKFYFVRTKAMFDRAQTKIIKNGWDIRVVEI